MPHCTIGNTTASYLPAYWIRQPERNGLQQYQGTRVLLQPRSSAAPRREPPAASKDRTSSLTTSSLIWVVSGALGRGIRGLVVRQPSWPTREFQLHLGIQRVAKP
jgi:hypothetical protein